MKNDVGCQHCLSGTTIVMHHDNVCFYCGSSIDEVKRILQERNNSHMKQGVHELSCKMVFPNCKCNTCQNDYEAQEQKACCQKHKKCTVEKCEKYVKDEQKGETNDEL